jgi:hypothetical protein
LQISLEFLELRRIEMGHPMATVTDQMDMWFVTGEFIRSSFTWKMINSHNAHINQKLNIAVDRRERDGWAQILDTLKQLFYCQVLS